MVTCSLAASVLTFAVLGRRAQKDLTGFVTTIAVEMLALPGMQRKTVQSVKRALNKADGENFPDSEVAVLG
ncbi:hypothetical protein DFH08DRAFT_237771 [Mycena albidolilacea]|uniref:Uncharacterized protein n=1 Tax=Mycena albidolilacea TaxID=1033008 RepID=A0AAD7ENL0_9AGAR|nr:hypothetical protein DFH08DRAFT_237771 [Mycena albidolilacea]